MIELSQETEQLLQAKAIQAGKTPEQIVREALALSGKHVEWKRPDRRPAPRSKQEFINGLEEIAVRAAARPAVDPRSADEIIGYDDFGLPR